MSKMNEYLEAVKTKKISEPNEILLDKKIDKLCNQLDASEMWDIMDTYDDQPAPKDEDENSIKGLFREFLDELKTKDHKLLIEILVANLD